MIVADQRYGLAKIDLSGKVTSFGNFDALDYASHEKFINNLNMFYHVANIGDARSLAIHPASTTHSQLSDEEMESAGVTPSYVRLSIGIEHIDDIIEDLKNALDAA